MSKYIVEVTTDTFEDEIVNSDMPVMIDFWATWCGPCMMAAPIVDELADEYRGRIKLCKVNVDEQVAIAAEYNIQSIPSFLFLKKGKLVNKVVGLVSKDALKNEIENIL